MSEQQSTNEENEDDVSSSTSNKERSDVWNYFDKSYMPDGTRMAICTGCNKTLSAKVNSGTSNLKRHLPKCFDLKHNYPFSYVEHEATRDLHKFLHRDANPISRNTAKADILKIYEKEKMSLKTKLAKVSSRVCLTADLWSSITTDGYMALTAHYVDENWILRKKVLNFRFIPPPHSGSTLAELFNEYRIQPGTTHDYSTTGSSSVSEGDAAVEDELDGFEAFPSQYQRVDTSDKSEVTKYLEEPEISRKLKIDVLQYWKDNKGRYPRLAQMARDILSIPITTVASESSFSIGGRIISKYRSSLSSSNAEALLCTRDWLFDVEGEEEEEGLGEDIEALIPSISSTIF